MNVHIYKGAVGKSVIFEELLMKKNTLGFVYFKEDRPHPRHIGGVYMVPYDLVKAEEFIEYLTELLTDKITYVIIYTNCTEAENQKLKDVLTEYKDCRTVILMCKED